MANSTPKVPIFASVVQPNYRWEEKTSPMGVGQTSLPPSDTDGKGVATISIPDGPFAETPEGKLIRLHELLHARFTPEIEAVARSRDGHNEVKSASGMAMQISEDVRLHALGHKLGLFGDDIYVSNDTYKKAGAKVEMAPILEEVKLAKTYMAGYGLPTEGDWSSKDLEAFQEHTGRSFSRRSRRVLKAWSRIADQSLTISDASDQFSTLANQTQKAINKLLYVPPSRPSCGKKDDQNADGGGGGSGGDGKKGPERDHPQTPQEIKKERDSLAEARANPIDQAYLNAQLRACDNALADYKKNSKVGQWKPAVFEPETIEQMEEEAMAATKAVYMPSLAPHWSRYEPMRGPKPDEALAKDYSLDPMDTGWHKMETALAPLERNFKALVKRKGVSSPEGPIPKFFNRWYSDKQLFERKGRRLGGTLLVDISGSMGWSHDATLALIEATPAMTIAVYSSNGDNSWSEAFDKWLQIHNPYSDARLNAEWMKQNRTAGRMTIIAQHGKLIPSDYILHGKAVTPKCAGHGSGNEVDGRALAWLCRQPRPRVWFSDGQVTGTGEVSSTQLYEDSRRLQRLGAIIRTTNTNAVKKIFNGESEGSWRHMADVYMPGGME